MYVIISFLIYLNFSFYINMSFLLGEERLRHGRYIFILCVCVTYYISFLILFESPYSFFRSDRQNRRYSVLFPPLLYADASFAPAIRRRCLTTPTYRRPTPSLVFDITPSSRDHILCLASGSLSPVMAPAVPLLLHPPYSVSTGCTPPCTWRHGGEGCWISLLLVISKPLRIHTSTNIPTSDYY